MAVAMKVFWTSFASYFFNDISFLLCTAGFLQQHHSLCLAPGNTSACMLHRWNLIQPDGTMRACQRYIPRVDSSTYRTAVPAPKSTYSPKKPTRDRCDCVCFTLNRRATKYLNLTWYSDWHDVQRRTVASWVPPCPLPYREVAISHVKQTGWYPDLEDWKACGGKLRSSFVKLSEVLFSGFQKDGQFSE